MGRDVVAGGVRGHMHGRGACRAGGAMSGRWGMCGKGAYMARGICGDGRGACMAGQVCATQLPPPSRHYGIQSMSGQYASYWNAFLLGVILK